MNELRIDPSADLRNSARGRRLACTFTPSAYSARSPRSTFLSSMVTSIRSMSDLAQTVSCDRLPQRMAARMERSSLTCSTSASSAALNVCWTGSGRETVERGLAMPSEVGNPRGYELYRQPVAGPRTQPRLGVTQRVGRRQGRSAARGNQGGDQRDGGQHRGDPDEGHR